MENRKCPACAETGHDKTGNHLYLMADGVTWTCRKSEYHTNGQIYFEREDGTEKPVIKGMEVSTKKKDTKFNPEELTTKRFRKIPASYYEHFGVKMEVSEDLGLPVKVYYPFFSVEGGCYWKIRIVEPKDFRWVESPRKVKLKFFGQDLCVGRKRLVITEGQDDAVAAHYMLEKYHINCVSTTHGDKVQVFLDNFDFLREFEEVIFLPDQDKAGLALLEEVVKVLPKVKVGKTLKKDACEMLKEDLVQEFITCVFNAKIHSPPTVINVEDVLDKALEPPKWGRLWPWPGLNSLTYGRRDGEGMFLGSGVKNGKSSWINEIAAHNIKVGGPPIALVKYEEDPANTLKRLAGKLDNCVYHNPEIPFDKDALRERLEYLQGKVLMYKTPPGRPADWELLKAYIRFVVLEYGVKDIVIDPVTRITNHLDSSDTETLLRGFADELSAMAQQLGFFYIVTCHLKAPASGPAHERGGEIQSNQFRGSRAMMEACYQMAGLRRNRDPELPEEERNKSQLILLEEREYGNTGIIDLFYDKYTQNFWEEGTVPPNQLYGETKMIPTEEGNRRLTQSLNKALGKVYPEEDIAVCPTGKVCSQDKVKVEGVIEEPKKKKPRLIIGG